MSTIKQVKHPWFDTPRSAQSLAEPTTLSKLGLKAEDVLPPAKLRVWATGPPALVGGWRSELGMTTDVDNATCDEDGDQSMWPLNSVGGMYLNHLGNTNADLLDHLCCTSPLCPEHKGMSDVEIACFIGHSDMLAQLFDSFSTDFYHRTTGMRFTPLHYCILGADTTVRAPEIFEEVMAKRRDRIPACDCGARHAQEWLECVSMFAEDPDFVCSGLVNAKDALGRTPLHLATACATSGDPDIFNIMMVLGQMGADPDNYSRLGMPILGTPLTLCWTSTPDSDPVGRAWWLGMVMVLLELGASTDRTLRITAGVATQRVFSSDPDAWAPDLLNMMVAAAARRSCTHTPGLLGQPVRLCGLKTASINGSVGMVTSLYPTQGRYVVMLSSENSKSAAGLFKGDGLAELLAGGIAGALREEGGGGGGGAATGTKKKHVKKLVRPINLRPLYAFVGEFVRVDTKQKGEESSKKAGAGYALRSKLGFCVSKGSRKHTFIVRLKEGGPSGRYRYITIPAGRLAIAREVCNCCGRLSSEAVKLKVCPCLTAAYCPDSDCQRAHRRMHRTFCERRQKSMLELQIAVVPTASDKSAFHRAHRAKFRFPDACPKVHSCEVLVPSCPTIFLQK